MTQYGYNDNKPALLKRLNRIEGQVRGVSKMVQNDTYCIDILTQVGAAKAALDKVALELVRDHARHCLDNDMVHAHHHTDKADELVDAIGRML
jgi:DNA-binding FrmR family transcriptional regulator